MHSISRFINKVIAPGMLLCAAVAFQTITVQAQNQADNAPSAIACTPVPFVNPVHNKISQVRSLDCVFDQLYHMAKTNKGVVRIVHIGDSHIQADYLSGMLREQLQNRFGYAGRGLVFPYQLAKSNAPEDIKASSNLTWKYNRISHPEIPVETGISGFGIHTGQRGGEISFSLKNKTNDRFNYFESIQLFTGSSELPVSFVLCSGRDGEQTTADSCISRRVVTQAGRPLRFTLLSPENMFNLTFRTDPDEQNDFSVYGFSLERKNAVGILYHTIGVNGAQMCQYTNSSLFWEQLNAFKTTDLYIISLGTNEAQNQLLTRDSMLIQCNDIYRRILSNSPNAMCLFTTPPASYYKGKAPNRMVGVVAMAIRDFCTYNNLPCWDLYTMTGGARGTQSFKKSGMMAKDLVHFNKAGYQAQGCLLYGALMDAYDAYCKRLKGADKK